jgi:hypothetical protein
MEDTLAANRILSVHDAVGLRQKHGSKLRLPGAVKWSEDFDRPARSDGPGESHSDKKDY